MIDLWYKNAIIYSLDVETFADSNGDGIGDFAGLTAQLDYLSGLNINCVWLLPFYPSPNRDNGYDVTDFYGVDRRLGTLGDPAVLAHRCRRGGESVLVIHNLADKKASIQIDRGEFASLHDLLTKDPHPGTPDGHYRSISIRSVTGGFAN